MAAGGAGGLAGARVGFDGLTFGTVGLAGVRDELIVTLLLAMNEVFYDETALPL